MDAGNYQEAYSLIEKMRDRSIVLSYYLEQTLVEVTSPSLDTLSTKNNKPASHFFKIFSN